MSDFLPDVRPIAALRARVWIGQGRLAEAIGWAREQGLSAEDDLSYLREFEHITLARVLLARPRAMTADHSTRRGSGPSGAPPARPPRTVPRTGSVIEILVLQALARARSEATSAPRSCRWNAP